LAVELRINANTVAKVYAELERSRYSKPRRGVGTFVSARHFTASHREEHEKHLHELVDRFVEEASAMGFSLDDLLDQLQSRRKKETEECLVYESDSNQE
jgi:GntR family transcriptional regulator